MSRTSRFVRILTCAFVFLLLGGLMLSAPSKASAAQITESIDSTMTITMQQTSGDGSTNKDASSNNSTINSTSDNEKNTSESATTSTVASKKDGNLPVTGDVLLFAIIGMVVLCAGSIYCLFESKKLNCAHGVHVCRSFQRGHIRTQDPNKIKKRVVVVAVTCALLAATCFGVFASKANALSEGVNADVKCTSAVKIDEDGNVLQANVTVQNNSLKAINVESVVAPTELEGWNATFKTTSVAVSGSAVGTWDGKTVPADILRQVKENGSLTLTFQLTVSTEPDPLDFSQFSLEEGEWVYDSTQKTPEVVCTGALIKDTDYTVTYDENVNAGEGTVTITGKGEYTGSKDFKFTIAKAKLNVAGIKVDSKTYDATTVATFNYDDMSVAGKVGNDDVSVTATGAFPSANVGTQDVALTLALAGTDAGNYEIDTKASQSSAQGKITKATVMIGWNTTDSFEYNGHDQKREVTSITGVNNETLGIMLAVQKDGTTVTEHKNVGTYTSVVTAVTGDTASNYDLPTEEASIKQNFSITRKTVKVSGITASNKTYDGTTDAMLNLSSLSWAGIEEGDTLSLVSANVTGTFASKNASEAAQTVTITYGTDALGGTSAANYILATAGEGGSQQTTTATISKVALTFTWTYAETAPQYDAETHTPTLTVTGAASGEIVTSTVTYTKKGDETAASVTPKDAATYVATATISMAQAVNYSLPTNTTTEFTIAKAPVTITWDPTGEAKYEYDGAKHTPTATVGNVVSGESLSTMLSYEDSSGASPTSAPSEIGTYTAIVVGLSGTTASNYSLPGAGLTKSFEIFSNVYTIVYHGNGGVTSDDKDAYTQTCPPDAAGTLDANAFTQSGKTFAFWTVGTESSGAITSDNAKTTNTYLNQYSFTSSFEGAAKGSAVHLYAYWKDNNTGNYWMNDANAADPGANATKTQSDIDNNKSSASFWTNLYNGGNDALHLYTYWNGTEADPVKFANRFVEFRILQVGEHDSDGSVVTFMATHSLPTAKSANHSATNSGGWASSAMRNSVFGESGYVQTGLSGLKNTAKVITKVATSGSYEDGWVKGSTTQDKFWLMSYSELFGENSWTIDDSNQRFKVEGTQYDWCKANVTNPTGLNSAIADMDKTRAGGNTAWADDPGCWLRSPLVYNFTAFGGVSSGGGPSGKRAILSYAVVPAFAF